MNASMWARSLMLLVLGAFATLHPRPAAADVPPLDFPQACINSLNFRYFTNPPAQVWSGLAALPKYVSDQNELVSLWRVRCGGGEAALQMRLGFWDPLNDPQVSMPRLTVRQDGRDVDIGALSVGEAYGPWTMTPVPTGATPASPGMFVLSSVGAGLDLKKAFTLLVRHPFSGAVTLTLDIPAFAPDPLPLNGRLVGNFYDPAKSGEGMLVEMVDLGHAQPGERQRHYLQYNWFTYDNDGRPFWISGGGEFLEGDSHVHMPAIYRGGGRFAGRQAPTETTPWGTVDMEFGNCNTLRIGYHSNADLPSNVPSGSGQLEWKRLTSVSGYSCDPEPAVAEAPPMDIPAACLSSLLDGVYWVPNPGSWQGVALLPTPTRDGGDSLYPHDVSFWRVDCGGGKAALQMRLGSWVNDLSSTAVKMPRLTVRQMGREVDVSAVHLRPVFPVSATSVAVGAIPPTSPGMFVLTSGGADVDLQGALTMLVKNPFSGAVALTLDIPAHAAVTTPLPLDGRLVGNFYDPMKPGEGMLLEIVDLGPQTPQGQPPLGRRRQYLQYSWFTYDNAGRPFWISGGAEFLEGDRHVHMPAIYRGGGRFAGGRAPTDITAWGTIDMEFADCDTLRIGYSGNADLPSNVPSGSGQLEWKRLTGVSGYRCD